MIMKRSGHLPILLLLVWLNIGAIPWARQVVTTAQPESFPGTGTASTGRVMLPGPEDSRSAYGMPFSLATINPLTGLPVEEPALLRRRPIIVKVTNFPRSVRPQWGLSLADHVYEYYIGDHMTRFIAIFYGRDAERAGPVRSARLFDEHILRMYKGVFVFGWADDPVLDFLTRTDLRPFLLVEHKDNCPPLCRIGPNAAYNNLYVDTGKVGAYLAKRRTNNERQELNGLRFDGRPPKSGNPGAAVSIRYSAVSYHRWEYDPISARYLRFQDARDNTGEGPTYAPLMDRLTDEQLSAANVIVLLVPHGYLIKYSAAAIIDQPLQGQGTGYAFRDGQVYPITWKAVAANKLLELSLPNGQLYPLKPGNTWFEVLSEKSNLKPEGSSSWKFDFVFP